MNEQVRTRIEQYPMAIVEQFEALRQLIYDSTDATLVETLWAGLPSYYVGNAFVRLIPFKDYINIEAKAAMIHKEELSGYKITPKGMIQVFAKQPLSLEVLKRIFRETLN